MVFALVAAGCSPGPTSTPPTAAAPPSGPITWSGTPAEKSPTWAADLDPDSAYGLHRRKGLATVVRPELVPLAAADTSALTSVDIVNRAECLSDAAQHPMCRFRLVVGSEPVALTLAYLNRGAVGRAVTYSWTRTTGGITTPVTSGTGGTDGTGGDTSVRTYAPPSPWGHSATFTAVATDTLSGATLTTRTLTITWDSLPR